MTQLLALLELVKGKKTYLLVTVGIAILVAELLGYIPHDSALKLYEILGLTSLAALRDAVKQVETQVKETQAVLGSIKKPKRV